MFFQALTVLVLASVLVQDDVWITEVRGFISQPVPHSFEVKMPKKRGWSVRRLFGEVDG